MKKKNTGKTKEESNIENRNWGKTRQNVENNQTFDLRGEIEIEGKTRQNVENKQTLDLTQENWNWGNISSKR